MKPVDALVLANHLPTVAYVLDAFSYGDAGCLAAISTAKVELGDSFCMPVGEGPRSHACTQALSCFCVALEVLTGSLKFEPLSLAFLQHDSLQHH